MAVNDIFKKVPVEIPNHSGFDCSHENAFTAKCGTLVPCMVDMLLPGDKISLSVGSEIQLPPMATDFYGRIKGHFEAFFVPFRILYGGWQELITHPVNGDMWPSDTYPSQKAKYLPTLEAPLTAVGRGSLADYLGFKVSDLTGVTSDNVEIQNPLRFLAYHKIYDAFYRDSRIQKEVFGRIIEGADVNTLVFGNLPYTTRYDSAPLVLGSGGNYCIDLVPFYELRQRNFGRDYFTNATPLPQAGLPAQLAFGINTETDSGSFSIASLRAANALQMWLERNNVAGYRYGDQIRAHFGVYPTDAALDRPLYLGREIVDVYNKSVYQNNGNQAASQSNNPFSSVGSKYGSPLGVGKGQLVDHFEAKEHGYIFVMFSLVPDSVYSTGIDREFKYNNVADFPFPLLAGVGDQEIYREELEGVSDDVIIAPWSEVFGYTQRYANHKHKLDECHGLLVDGESLESFMLQRGFSVGGAELGADFIKIPTDYLDQVTAVSADGSKYGCWVDSYWNYHKSSTLPAYSIPTLAEPKNTHTEVIDNGGTRL